jgi:hypothetical protein
MNESIRLVESIWHDQGMDVCCRTCRVGCYLDGQASLELGTNSSSLYLRREASRATL